MREALVLVAIGWTGVAEADRISAWPPRANVKPAPTNNKPARAVKNNCDSAAGYAFSFGATDKPSSPELHQIQVYEANNRSSGKSLQFTLTIDRPGPVYLDLSSYEPVEWKIVASLQTQVVAVNLHGYHRQTAIVDNDTTVYQDSYEAHHEKRGPERGWPNSLPATSSASCYHMSELEIR